MLVRHGSGEVSFKRLPVTGVFRAKPSFVHERRFAGVIQVVPFAHDDVTPGIQFRTTLVPELGSGNVKHLHKPMVAVSHDVLNMLCADNPPEGNGCETVEPPDGGIGVWNKVGWGNDEPPERKQHPNFIEAYPGDVGVLLREGLRFERRPVVFNKHKPVGASPKFTPLDEWLLPFSPPFNSFTPCVAGSEGENKEQKRDNERVGDQEVYDGL